MIDNIHINEHDQLVAAGHPNVLAFILHEKNPRERRAPSEVILFTEPKSGEFTFSLPSTRYLLSLFRLHAEATAGQRWWTYICIDGGCNVQE